MMDELKGRATSVRSVNILGMQQKLDRMETKLEREKEGHDKAKAFF
jgi:hypothetical protein